VQRQVKEALSDESPVYSRLLIGYFLLSIALIGGVFAYAIAIPLCLLGRYSEKLWRLGGRSLQRGVQCLLRVQPWYRADVRVELPARDPQTGMHCLTVSNHRSHLDMFILLTAIPNIRVISKRALFRVPFLGVMMWVMKNIPITRGEPQSYWEAMETAAQALRDGDTVHVFPEMTRCEPGDPGTGDFHLAPFKLSLQTGVPLVPIVFVGTDRTWPKGTFGLAFRQPIEVKSLAPLSPKDFPSADALRAETKSRIEAYLLRRAPALSPASAPLTPIEA